MDKLNLEVVGLLEARMKKENWDLTRNKTKANWLGVNNYGYNLEGRIRVL